jgi:hypothetical protein
MVWLSAFLISLVVAVAPVVAEKVFFASPTPSGPLTVQASVDRNPCSPPAKTPGFDRWLAEEYFPDQRWEPYRFPYTVDIAEPEMFFITATTLERDVRWVIDLTWVSGNERGVIVVDDNGEPFRLVGLARATAACTWGEGGGLVEGPCSETR